MTRMIKVKTAIKIVKKKKIKVQGKNFIFNILKNIQFCYYSLRMDHFFGSWWMKK